MPTRHGVRRAGRWWRALALPATGLLAVLALLGALLYAKAEHIVLGAEAYLYGYPLVVMDVTRAAASHTLGPENQLFLVRKFPDAGFKEVVRPNVDTLYTTAFIDMAQGPWVFEMAPNASRYEVMTFMDAWTNVFAAPGTRTTGTLGGRFLLVGPGWRGTVPAGHALYRSPTRLVWLIGRTATHGVGDYDHVHGLQDGIRLRALDKRPSQSVQMAPPSAPSMPPPAQQMADMDVASYFARLALLMVDNPPNAADAPMLIKLARIGIAPGQPPQWSALERGAVALGRWIAERKVSEELKAPRDNVNGWTTPPAVLGDYGSHYNIRAVVAMVGLGANLPQDAMYPSASVDSQGRALDGGHRYRLHFSAYDLPPVNAFWSVTAYGSDNFFLDHSARRYAIGDRDPLVYNADGSLDLWLQDQPPELAARPNWLPVKAGQAFLLTARLYWPKPAALEGRWNMPSIERMD